MKYIYIYYNIVSYVSFSPSLCLSLSVSLSLYVNLYRIQRGSRSSPVHLFFTGNEWMLHLDVDADLDINHCLAYSEVGGGIT